MRLIDADNLVEKVERARTFVFAGTGDRLFADGICDGVIAQINVEPTVDAVPVVRCKDCPYSRIREAKGGKKRSVEV